ncbi:hypothetical protein [Streptomyces sp. NPDC086787]|uniref:hypothetical protein n=1 Tax=Streptomyces sp. NPDC086787 TaxID=3365759 RepID=UPI00382EC24B
MSKADVALALRHTKEFLVAANLDPQVLGGAGTGKVLSLLDASARRTTDELRRGVRTPSRTHDPLIYISRFDPSEAELVGKAVKVRGRMTFEAGEPGQVLVHADYSFVYPVVPVHGDGQRVHRVVVRRGITMLSADPNRWRTSPGKLQLTSTESEFMNVECGGHGYFHPVFDGTAHSGPKPTGDPFDPYDRGRKLSVEDGACSAITRS